MSQNIYDDETFFSKYIELREGINFNDILEQPLIQSLVPDVEGLRVLDLGCGFGVNTMKFINEGAIHVTGVDLSSKMLHLAKEKNAHPRIEYLKMDMKDLDKLKQRYDLIYSSLAFHYVEDFDKLIKNVNELLTDEGILVFSQEHPIDTATHDLKHYYTYDDNKEAISYTFSNYGDEGKRTRKWFVENVENYHRKMETVINTLIENGFMIQKIIEPIPTEEQIMIAPHMKKNVIKPTFLIIRAKKSAYDEI